VYDLDGTQLNPDLQIEDRNGNYPNGTGRKYSATYTGSAGSMPTSLQIPGESKPYTYTYPESGTAIPLPLSIPLIPNKLNIAQCPTAVVNATVKPVGRDGSGKLDRGISGGSGLLWPRMAGERRSNEQTSPAESHSGIQGEGGLGRIER
jgi:hypothetical protein